MAEASGEKTGEEKKKKVKAAAPVPPGSVEAGCLIIQAALAKVFGLDPKSSGQLQPVWVTEPGAGKVTMDLTPSRRSPFPKDPAQHKQFLDLVEKEVEKLNGIPLKSLPETNLLGDLVGTGKLIVVGDECVFAIDPSQGVAKTANVTVVRGQIPGKKPDTMILLAGKKKQVSVKFTTTTTTDEEDLDVYTDDVEKLAGTMTAAYRTQDLADIVIEKDEASSKEEEEAVPDDETQEMVVDPFQVSGKIDYEKLIVKFGSQRITDDVLVRMKKLMVDPTRKLHRFLRRKIFFSHRDMDKICDLLEKKSQPFYLYTGRGPSSSAMHLGHLVPFMMTQWLQEAYGVPLVIQMTDDEKFLWKGQYNDVDSTFDLDHYRSLTRENVKDIIACGFQKDRTFIFSDCEYIGHLYPNVLKIAKSVTYSQAKGAFGFDGASNIGQSVFPAIQAAPSFGSSFSIPLANFPGTLSNAPCLIPCAIDQDPYFRVTRDVASKLVPRSHPLNGKPALLHSKFFPPLTGALGKMSSSTANFNGAPPSAVFLTDSPDAIEKTIKTHAFSGGQETAKLQREHGADLDKDVAFQWLTFFLEDDDELKTIAKDYGSGSGHYWNTAAVKAKLVSVLQDLIAQHQAKRNAVTDAQLDEWFALRPLAPPVPRP